MNHRSLLLNITKEFYEYCANHTINLSPPSDLVSRWTTTVGGAVDRLGGSASPAEVETVLQHSIGRIQKCSLPRAAPP